MAASVEGDFEERICFVDCHAHISAKEFQEVHYFETYKVSES